MLKKILAVLLMLYAAVAFAAVDVNKATAAELDSVKGIGPTTSKRIVDERKKGDYKSWEDLISRVKGIGEGNAAKFSAEGLTVNGAAMKGAAATKKETKAGVKAETKADTNASTKAEKKSAKEEKKEAKAAAKEEKKEEKAEKKEDKKGDKVAAAKPAASAAKATASAKK